MKKTDLAYIAGIIDGEIRKASEVGFNPNNRHKVVWQACPLCGKERWLEVISVKLTGGRCQACFHRLEGKKRKGKPTGRLGELSGTWKGGRSIDKDGYIEIYIYPNDFFYPMAKKNGYIYEHRLVMAKSLKRCLLPWEVVHHRNGNKHDNRQENLQLLPSQTTHIPSIQLRNKVKRLENEVSKLSQRILILEAENIVFRASSNMKEEAIN